MSNLLDLKQRKETEGGNPQNIRRIDRPLSSNQREWVEDEEEMTQKQNLYQNNYTENRSGPIESETEEEGIPNTTLGLMIGTAIFFDLTQVLLAFVVMDWLVSWFAFLTFWLWFKFHNKSFLNPKRLPAIGVGVVIEMFPLLAALPGWTIAVILLVGIERAEKTARKLLGEGTLGNKAISKISRFSKK